MNIIISTHKAAHASAFKTLNLDWLKRYFAVEPIDEYVLSHPEKIIEDGGQILYLLKNNQVLGCCALKQHDAGSYELTKMAVDQAHQGQGLGHLLMDAAIKWFIDTGGRKLYLETNSKLKPAIQLYEKYNFIKMPCPFDTEYQRADYYMEWQP